MTNRELYRPHRKLNAFRATIYPLNIAILYEDSPTRMKKVNTFHHFIDVFETFTHFGALKTFSIASVPYYASIPPLTFTISQIKTVTEAGMTRMRVCKLTCDQLQWEKEHTQMTDIPEYVEKRLWTHIKNTHPSLFDTFHLPSLND